MEEWSGGEGEARRCNETEAKRKGGMGQLDKRLWDVKVEESLEGVTWMV